MLRLVAVSLLVAAAAPALAQTAAPQGATPQAKPVDPLDKVVCRMEDTIGSRLKKHKVCATVREWKDQQDENQAAFNKFMQHAQMQPKSE